MDYLDLESDSLTYYSLSAWGEVIKDNLDRAAEYFYRGFALDSTNAFLLFWAGHYQMAAGNYEDGLRYMRKSADLSERHGIILHNVLHRIGYYLFQAGYRQEAEYYFDRQEEVSKKLIELDRPYAQMNIAQLDLALTYAFRGKKDSAMDLLKIISNESRVSMITLGSLSTDPMVESIRKDPEFQQIANDLRIRYQADQERIRQWLEENDML